VAQYAAFVARGLNARNDFKRIAVLVQAPDAFGGIDMENVGLFVVVELHLHLDAVGGNMKDHRLNRHGLVFFAGKF